MLMNKWGEFGGMSVGIWLIPVLFFFFLLKRLREISFLPFEMSLSF